MTQSACRALTSLARCIAFALVLTGLSACGMSSLTSGIGGGLFGSKKSTNTEVGSVNEDQLLAAAKTDSSGSLASISGSVAHGCPRFQVWSRDGYVTIYEQGRVGDALAVMHRGEITKTARNATSSPAASP